MKMAFGDRYKTAWRTSEGHPVEIVEGSSTDASGVSFCMFIGDEPHPFHSRPKSLNAARALVALFALGCNWHADINAEVGLFDKNGILLPDPDDHTRPTGRRERRG
jgi:hypothetical protein